MATRKRTGTKQASTTPALPAAHGAGEPSALRRYAEEIRADLASKKGRAWRKAFLLVLARSGNVSLACEASGVSR